MVPLEEPSTVVLEGRAEGENAVVENSSTSDEPKPGMGCFQSIVVFINDFTGSSISPLIVEEAVATADVAEAAIVSPTKEAAEPAEMSNTVECSPEPSQSDPSSIYAEKLKLWRETGTVDEILNAFPSTPAQEKIKSCVFLQDLFFSAGSKSSA